jgi:hypothetical protein
MTKATITKNAYLVPLGLVFVLILFYLLFSNLFINGKVDGASISQVSTSESIEIIDTNLSTLNNTLKNINGNINSKTKEITDQEIVLDNATISNISTKKEKQVIELATAKITKLKRELEWEKNNFNAIDVNANSSRTQLLNARTQHANKYSQRSLWVFLTGVFFVLCIISIVIAGVIFERAQSKNSWYYYALALVTIGGGFGLLVLSGVADYMPVTKTMLEQTISNKDNPELSMNFINFFNACGFMATIGLVFASSAILHKVGRIDEIDKISVDWKSYNKKLEEYAVLFRYLRTIMYVGAVMLFVGILRLSALLDWHKLFVTAESQSLIKIYADTMLSIQGTFYTLQLAAIYLPAAYIIREAANLVSFRDVEDAAIKIPGTQNFFTNEDKTALLTEKKLVFNLTDFITRIAAILSPLVAGPIKTLLGYFMTK